ncbi:MAG: ACT domain-containing protein [Clostridia bacterium]|nr:ACT domain-containing protein [Clostridia bacterium]
MEKENFLIVNSKILPEVFLKVVSAKQLLSEGIAPNTSKAVKMVGISRSAFYKYKDYVFRFEKEGQNILTFTALLSDKAGVFSAMANVFYEVGANIITVNQSTPVDGTAKVVLTANTDNVSISVDELIAKLKKNQGIIGIKAE